MKKKYCEAVQSATLAVCWKTVKLKSRNADPEQFDDDFHEEVAAKRQFAEQAELGEREPELEAA